MSSSAESLATLGLLEARIATPPRLSALYPEFRTWLADRPESRLLLKEFIRSVVDQLIESINHPFLQKLARDSIEAVRREEGIDYGTFAFNGTESGEVDVSEILRTLNHIFVHLGTCQRQREQLTHYAATIKHAETYIDLFNSALKQFIQDEDVVEGAWQHLSERKRASEGLLIDLDSFKTSLAMIRTDLANAIENIISPRNQLLLRTESSLRLLAKFNEQDMAGNLGQARHNRTTSPAERSGTQQSIEDSGFTVQEVQGIR